MIPIALCAVAALYFIGDGILRTSRRRIAPAGHEQSVKALFRQGDYTSAHKYCRENPSALTSVLGVAISSLGDGNLATEKAMAEALAKKERRLQTDTAYLLLIAICAPLIGLLGTITALMSLSLRLGASAIGDHPGLAARLGETLGATAFGLVVGLLALAAFHLLRNRAAASILHVREVVNDVFRRMPYESLAGVHLGDEELYAAVPKSPVESEDKATTPLPNPRPAGKSDGA